MKLPGNALIWCVLIVVYVVDIHTPDPESSVRSPAEGRIQGGYGKFGLRIQQ